MTRRRICVCTGTRAEYGILRWLMLAIRADPRLELQVLATGAHLEPRLGETWREIAADGFAILERVPLGLADDSVLGVSRSMALATAGTAEALARLAPDLVVVLGDRYEVLAMAQAALVARIPVAHIHGGEVTEGAIDDAIRHAVTKLSHLHFVAAPDYRRRVIQLGEAPDRVFDVGALGLDGLETERLLDRAQLAAEHGLPRDRDLLLVTYHPATLGDLPPEAAAAALFQALDDLPEVDVLVTGGNADVAASRIVPVREAFLARNPQRARFVESLGALRYRSMMAGCAAVVGNSSSGLIEAPALGKPSVNIGPRQHGRLRAPAVIDCDEDGGSIIAAIRRALLPATRLLAAERRSPYGRGGAAARIVEVIATCAPQSLLRKPFHDLPG